MTIQNTTIRKAGPSQGNGVTTVFPFTFKVFTATDILVTYLSASGVESALFLTTNYTVLLNADQNTSPGGSVTLLVAPSTGTYITLTSQVTNTQTLELTNSGGFYPESINNALDRTVIEIQQLAEKVDRAVKVPQSSSLDADSLLQSVLAGDTSAIYTPLGTGAVTRTVASKLNDTVSVKDFGAIGDGVTDDTVAIQNAINYTGSKLGGTILLPAGSYKITSTLSCLYQNILFVGDGSDEPHDKSGVSQGAAAATKLVWAGASGGTMLNIGSVNGVDNIKYSGGGVRSIFFNSGCTTNGTGAAYGIDVVSFNEGVFENVMFREFQNYGIRVGCVTQLWAARDPQHNRFINCWSRNFVNQSGGLFLLEGDTAMFSSVAATALVAGRTYVIVSPGTTDFTLIGAANNTIGTSFIATGAGAGTGTAYGMGGTYTLANVSLNHFENCGAQFYNGIAFNIKNSDHNFFINCRANRIATGTGQGIVFQGSNQRNTGALPGTISSDAAFVARKNVFFGFSGGNEIVAKGTTSYLYPSYKNIFTMMDDSNNTPFPTIETDALCYVTMRTDGVGYYPNQVSGVFSYAATIDNASAMALQARSRVVSESLRLENRNNNGLRIARPAASNLTIEGEWALAVIEAAGFAGQNLKVSRITGTGCLEVLSIAQNSVTITTATTTLTNTNAIVLVDATSGSRVITLPLAASYGTSVSPAIRIRRIDSSANTVTVQRQSTNALNGGTTETLAAVTGKTYICNGTADWYSL
jgi:hypothetical protein